MTQKPLSGKTAVVTGAGRGIGKSIALKFAEAGADVAICARSDADIAETQSEIEARGQRCIALSIASGPMKGPTSQVFSLARRPM